MRNFQVIEHVHCFMLELRSLAVSMTPSVYKLVIFYCFDPMFE